VTNESRAYASNLLNDFALLIWAQNGSVTTILYQNGDTTLYATRVECRAKKAYTYIAFSKCNVAYFGLEQFKH